MKYQFIHDALQNQKLKMNLSIISESEAENNKSYSKVGTPRKTNVRLLNINLNNLDFKRI